MYQKNKFLAALLTTALVSCIYGTPAQADKVSVKAAEGLAAAKKGGKKMADNMADKTASAWDKVVGNWNISKGYILKKWGNLTDDDLDRIQGRKAELIGVLRKKHHLTAQEAEQQVEEMTRQFEKEAGQKLDERIGAEKARGGTSGSTWDSAVKNWYDFKSYIKDKYSKLTDDELSQVQSKKDKLTGLLKEKYGYSESEANAKVDALVKDFQAGTIQKLDEEIKQERSSS